MTVFPQRLTSSLTSSLTSRAELSSTWIRRKRFFGFRVQGLGFRGVTFCPLSQASYKSLSSYGALNPDP